MNLTIDVAIGQVALTVPAGLTTDELRRRRGKEACDERHCLELLRSPAV